MRALDRWPRDGIPPEPRAWLTVTARRRAIDLIRREAMRDTKELAALALRVPDEEPPDHGVVRDDLLRLLFVCCHPALSVEAQTALALRTLGGLSTEEVASSLLVSPATMAKRLTRAKRKIQVARIPYEAPSPEDLPDRLQGVLTVVYLMFNEGYHASGGDGPLRRAADERGDPAGRAAARAAARPGLGARPRRAAAASRRAHPGAPGRGRRAGAARRAGSLAVGPRGGRPRARAARARAARLGRAPGPVRRAGGDRRLPRPRAHLGGDQLAGDRQLVRRPAHRGRHPGRAARAGDRHRRAAWPEAGLAALETIEGLEGHLPFVAGRAELLARSGRLAEARDAYRAALELPTNPATRRTLAARLDELG